MKKFDAKKIIIVLVIVALVVGVIILLGKSIKGNKVDEKELKNYEGYVTTYYANLTLGYNTAYRGLDVLYASDEITLDNISDKQLITVAINYLSMAPEVTNIDYETIQAIYSEQYPEVMNSALYSAEDIRKAIKTLFGIDNFANPSTSGDITYTFGYKYMPEEDIYIVVENKDIESLADENQFVDYRVIDTVAEKDKIVTTIAIIYGYVNGETITYASDRLGTNVVAENVKEFPKDKIDKLEKYAFTLTKTKDGKSYIFESVKKVK